MQSKLEELQEKLSGEESEKIALKRQVEEAEKRLDQKQTLEEASVYNSATCNSTSFFPCKKNTG